ncbi:hypothetical protein LAY57_33770 [Argonema antarcticum A004/B2]|nr:hypothetical protein [Argonema antarcticum A004/B2]
MPSVAAVDSFFVGKKRANKAKVAAKNGDLIGNRNREALIMLWHSWGIHNCQILGIFSVKIFVKFGQTKLVLNDWESCLTIAMPI